MPKTIECVGCGQERGEKTRGLCKTCYARNRKRRTLRKYPRVAGRKTVAIVADVEHLVGSDSRENIAKRLGYNKPDSLYRLLHRANRLDLWEAMAA